MSYSDYQEEKRLYEEARALKFKAREMRKKRLVQEDAARKREEERIALLNQDAEKKRKSNTDANKRDQDDRIRNAMFKIAAVVKEYQLAFDSPGQYNQSKPLFTFIDKKLYDVAATPPTAVVINVVAGVGFQWK